MSWLMQIGLIGSLLFVSGVFGWMAGVLAVLALVATHTRAPRRERISYPLLPTILLAVPLLIITVVITIVPLHDYDGRAFWLLKAKGIAHDRAVEGPFFRGEQVFDPRNDYPLLMPANAAVIMTATKSLDDRAVRLLYLATFIAFVLLVRERIGRLVSPAAGAWSAVLLAWLPQFLIAPEGGVTSAYSDIALAAFAAAAFFEVIAAESPRRLGLWLAFLILTKNEGLPFAVILLAAGAVVFRRRILEAAAAPAVALLTLVVWRHDIPPGEQENVLALLSTLPQKLGALAAPLRAVAAHAASWPQWGVFWIALVVAAAVAWKRARLAIGVIAAMLSVYIAVYTVTTWVQADLINSSVDRLLMHFAGPALFVLASAAFGDQWVRTKSM